MYDDERGAGSRGFVVEEEEERVQECGEEHAAGPKHSKALRSNGAHGFGEDIRDGNKNEIEPAIAGERPEFLRTEKGIDG